MLTAQEHGPASHERANVCYAIRTVCILAVLYLSCAPVAPPPQLPNDAGVITVNGSTPVVLENIASADQSDRDGSVEKLDWPAIRERDHDRRARVIQIIKSNGLVSARDYFNAAIVLQHGEVADDFLQAHLLAAKAAELDPALGEARWLAAAAKDRYLLRIGKPQIYGTQYRYQNGKWELDKMDETAISDAERARWNVPSLADAKARVKAMNQPQ
jgi:hypothetical protein